MSIKNKIFGLLIVCSFSIAVQGQSYQQSAGNLAAREQFQDIGCRRMGDEQSQHQPEKLYKIIAGV